jgi:Leucine-rich repeat (LRR) protein
LKIPKKFFQKHGFEWETNLVNFPDGKLIIKQTDYPNLKTLYACGLGLEEVELDHDGLENLYLVGNELTELDLSKTPNLVHLFASRNKLSTIIGLEQLTKLEDLRCNLNNLTSLDITNLKELQSLDASMNSLSEIKLGNNPLL